MKKAYRCPTCKQLCGYRYDEQLQLPLPKCPKGHDTEFVPKISDRDLASYVAQANLSPTARESQKIESQNQDPHTFRKRFGKQRTDG